MSVITQSDGLLVTLGDGRPGGASLLLADGATLLTGSARIQYLPGVN